MEPLPPCKPQGDPAAGGRSRGSWKGKVPADRESEISLGARRELEAAALPPCTRLWHLPGWGRGLPGVGSWLQPRTRWVH